MSGTGTLNLRNGLGRSTQGSSVTTHAAFSGHIVREPTHQWRGEVTKRFETLLKLPQGWNGYNGRPVALENVLFAMSLLESVCSTDFPAPSIVPGSNGDVQIEWHTATSDIELHIRRPNSVHAWRMTDRTGDEGEELTLSTNFKTIASWLVEMSEPAIAAEAAAA